MSEEERKLVTIMVNALIALGIETNANDRFINDLSDAAENAGISTLDRLSALR